MWVFRGQEIRSHDDLLEGCTDFVYMIQYTNGQRYIGKKTVRSESVLPAQKKGVRPGAVRINRHIMRDVDGKVITSKAGRIKARKQGIKAKREEFDVLLTDSPFVKYKGSHEGSELLEIKFKEILYQCSTKKAATYLEAALMFHHDAVFDPNYLNENISGVHFDNSLDGLLE